MSEFNIPFSQQQLAVLNNGLIKLPYEIAAPLINHINAEIQKAFDAKVDGDASDKKNLPSDEEII